MENTSSRLPRTKPADRRDQILDVASKIFVEAGYGATSMSLIAKHLGGSKATLYKYFSSKKDLFEAVMERNFQRFLEPLRELRSTKEDDFEFILTTFGARFLEMIYEPEAYAVYRLIQSEGARFPELAQAFFKSGPSNVGHELQAAMCHFFDADQFFYFDLELCASQFLGMLRGDRHLQFATGVLPAPDGAEIARHAQQAAKVFVRGLEGIMREKTT